MDDPSSGSVPKRRARRRTGREAPGPERQAAETGAAGPLSSDAAAVASPVGRAFWQHRNFIVSVLLLLATVWLGLTANDIVRAQNDIVGQQTRVAESIGREQNQTALLQGFIAATQGAGLETEREQRMLEVAILLYLELAKNPRYTRLSTSIPVPTSSQLDEILEGRNEEDKNTILQLYGRASDIDLVPAGGKGVFHVAIATFEDRQRAVEFVKAFSKDIRVKSARPVYVIQNRRGLFLVLMGGFSTSEEAAKNVKDLDLERQFQGVYVTQWRDWTEICGEAGGGLPCVTGKR